jgi:hypothetical protein
MKMMRNVHRAAVQPLRLGVVFYCLLLIGLAGTARGQGRGVVDGKLVNMTEPGKPAGVADLDVVGLGSGMAILKSSTTDAAGKFRIDGLPTDQPLMMRANYKGVNYHGRVNFDGSGKATVEIQVYEPTTSTKDIRVQDLRIAFQLTGDRLRALESCSFDNQTRPPRSLISADGSFRFSKPESLIEPPGVRVTGPGTAMPLTQSPLESEDGKSYYNLYPLRPGLTTFEVEQTLPYSNRSYTLRKKFFYDVDTVEIGVIPADLSLTGDGLKKLQDNPQQNFAVYSAGPIKAGTEVVWTFSGGTPVVEPTAQSEPAGEQKIRPMPTAVGRNSLVIAPLLLLVLVVVLWYAFNYSMADNSGSADPRMKELRDRREKLLNHLAGLDRQNESNAIDRREYLRQREQGKRQLRRISMLMGKKP